jgi:protein-tyrosine phosphatase
MSIQLPLSRRSSCSAVTSSCSSHCTSRPSPPLQLLCSSYPHLNKICHQNLSNLPNPDTSMANEVPRRIAVLFSSMSKLQDLMIQRTYERAMGWDGCEIFPNIYLGSLQAALDEENLRNNSICGVLTVANQLEVHLSEDILHLQVAITDHPCANILDVLPQSLEFIDRIILSNTDSAARKCIFIHCASGVSRSVSVCCAWLMTRQNMKLDESLDLIRQKRSRANPNLGFRQQLSYLERHGNVISAANEEYKSNFNEVNILDVIKQQRDEVNGIYARVDAIENQMKKVSETEMSQTQRSTWKNELYYLQSLLDQISQRNAQNPISDPPSKSIRKSATEKVIRLLDDLETALAVIIDR